MKIHYFQRYHKGEDVATANTMLLLSRLYTYSSDKFFQFVKDLCFSDIDFDPELNFDFQTNDEVSRPDATISKPDIVLQKYHVAIFVHGCFWHQHESCKDATTPKTRTKFWLEKFDKNVKNDQIKQDKLRELGWKVIVIWECELKRILF